MSTPEPPPYPGDPNPDEQSASGPDLPSYGSVPPPPEAPGAFPPPPPPPAAPSLGADGFSAPDAIMWGWRKFTENVGQVLLASITIFGVSILLGALTTALTGGFAQTTPLEPGSMNFSTDRPGSFLGDLVQTVVSLVLSGVAAKAALEVTLGQPYNFFAAFGKINYVRLILASLLVGLLVTVGFILLIIPGLIVLFLTYLTTYSLVDDDKSPIDAIKHSISLVSANVGDSLLLALLSIVVGIAGFLALCVGILVAIPVTVFAAAYAYRSFNGQPVAP
jgi:uncharacterized membrane protein